MVAMGLSVLCAIATVAMLVVSLRSAASTRRSLDETQRNIRAMQLRAAGPRSFTEEPEEQTIDERYGKS